MFEVLTPHQLRWTMQNYLFFLFPRLQQSLEMGSEGQLFPARALELRKVLGRLLGAVQVSFPPPADGKGCITLKFGKAQPRLHHGSL